MLRCALSLSGACAVSLRVIAQDGTWYDLLDNAVVIRERMGRCAIRVSSGMWPDLAFYDDGIDTRGHIWLRGRDYRYDNQCVTAHTATHGQAVDRQRMALTALVIASHALNERLELRSLR